MLTETQTPPPIPATCGEPTAADRIGDTFAPLGDRITPIQIIDALIKNPGAVVFEISRGRSTVTMAVLLSITAVFMALYGLVMGTFSGGAQLWLVPMKVAIGVLLSGLICLPSLYILSCLAGGTHSFRETTGLLLQALALNATLLLGFVPIVWVFSQATETTVFMGILHLAFWVTASYLSLRLLIGSLTFLNTGKSMTPVKAWAFVFLLVALQMSVTLRPLIGKADGAGLMGKKFFITHWSDCFSNPKP